MWTPFLIASTLKTPWVAFVATFIPVFATFSMNFIAIQLEMPFGDDDNDLPLSLFQHEMNRGLMMLLHPKADLLPKTSCDCVKDWAVLSEGELGKVDVQVAKLRHTNSMFADALVARVSQTDGIRGSIDRQLSASEGPDPSTEVLGDDPPNPSSWIPKSFALPWSRGTTNHASIRMASVSTDAATGGSGEVVRLGVVEAALGSREGSPAGTPVNQDRRPSRLFGEHQNQDHNDDVHASQLQPDVPCGPPISEVGHTSATSERKASGAVAGIPSDEPMGTHGGLWSSWA